MSKIVYFLIFCALCISGCYQEPRTLTLDHAEAYVYSSQSSTQTVNQTNQDLFEKYSPIFVVEENNKPYNRIGAPKIRRGPQKKLEAYVDPAQHPIFVQKVIFTTKKDSYTNLIYRVHFEKVPYGLRPFQITAGKNVGLLVIVTLNSNQEPVLITSVHTCGCYISMVPTNFLRPDAFPLKWKEEPKYRYGEKHPGMLHFPSTGEGYHPVFYLRTQTHRVTDIFVEKKEKIHAQYHPVGMPSTPIQLLDKLPVEGEDSSLSFYYQDLSKGFVKNSLKPFEFLIISWWAFDPNVGNDKKYAPASELHKRFYTSLNPAYWQESDLWNFPVAAKFWGWEL
ncbi:MAG: hypothetical protein KDK71_02405 [Chlamydiia bacterium]|nr:hypothetical protein [Chlamydiia bacterium]